MFYFFVVDYKMKPTTIYRKHAMAIKVFHLNNLEFIEQQNLLNFLKRFSIIQRDEIDYFYCFLMVDFMRTC